MSEHTPGPWAVDEAENGVTARGGEDMIADCDRLNGLSFEVSRANARLIAAAPELLEALERLKAEVENAHVLDIRKRTALCIATSVASTAIAKARGVGVSA